jgi:hypothetical protein
MTNVYITNVNNTISSQGPYFVMIECTNIDRDYVNNIKVTLNRPKAPASQNSASITQFIDLQQKNKVVTVTGYIDRYSLALDNNLVPISSVHDAGVIKQILEFMFDRGGTNQMVIGRGDGFYDITNSTGYIETITGILTRMTIKEDYSDRISKSTTSNDYPSSIPSPTKNNQADQIKIPNKYAVTITIIEGVLAV